MQSIRQPYVKKFILDIFSYLPSKMFPLLLSFLWSYIFTRIFTPEEYGIYGLIIAITGPLVTVITEWAAQPIGRFYSEYKNSSFQLVYYLILRRFTIIVFLLSIIIIVVSIIWGYFFYQSYLFLIIPAGISIIFNALSSLYMPILPASLDSRAFRKQQILRSVSRLVIAVSLVFGINSNVAFLVWADALSSIIFFFPLMNIIKNKIGLKEIKEDRINKNNIIQNHIKRFYGYGFPMMLWFFSSQLLNVGDRFAIQYFLGEKEVGIYTANYMLIYGISGLLSAPISLAAFPLIMKLWVNRDEERMVIVIKNMTLVFSIISIGVIGGTYLIAKPLSIIALGREFSEGYTVIFPVVLGLVVWQASMLGHKGMELKESTGIMVKLIILSACVNMVLNFLFIPIYGYEAAAWATFASYSLYAILVWYKSKDYIKWEVNVLQIVPFVIISIIGIFISSFIQIENVYIEITAKASLFSFCYLSLSALYLFATKEHNNIFNV